MIEIEEKNRGAASPVYMWGLYYVKMKILKFSVISLDATTLSFDGTEYMRISMTEGPTQAEDIRLRMKTTRPSGLLFTTVSEKSNTHLSASLEAGRMKLVLNLGDGNKV